MYVRIEKYNGFIVKGFRTKLSSDQDIILAKEKLEQELEDQRKYPRVTYGVLLSTTNNPLQVDTYIAGVIGDSSIQINSKDEVIISTGRYVIATSGNELYNSLEFLQMIAKTNYFTFRKAPILEKYSRDIETGEEEVELWVPIE